MLFDVNGIKWTIAAILVVLALCALDLRCSSGGDETASPASSVISRVKGEVAAGKQAYASMRAEQLEEQLRGLRVMAKKLVRDGNEADARRVILTIQEMEKDLERLRGKSNR